MRILAGMLTGAALLALGMPALAADAVAGTRLQMQVEAKVAAVPDVAEVEAGVVTTAPDAQAALAANSARMTRVVAALKAQGVAARDIRTTQVSLQAKYSYPQNAAPKLEGFEATNSVQVTLRAIGKAGAVLDALVKEGANRISGPNFSFSNPEPLLDKARAAAVQKAAARAALYADAAGLKVGRLVAVEESGVGPQPMPRMMMASAKAMDSAPPVEAGEKDVGVSLAVTWELVRR